MGNDGLLTPSNDDTTFGFFAWAGAFSPINTGPAPCSDYFSRALHPIPPFCVNYPFQVAVTPYGVIPEIVGGSFVPNQPIINLWNTFDPYFILDTANKELLKRQAIYLDAEADPNRDY